MAQSKAAYKKYMREYMKKRYSANPLVRAKQIASVLARYYGGGRDSVIERNRQRKIEVLTHYSPNESLGCSWAECDVDDLDMLSLDHVKNEGNKHRKEVGPNMYRWVQSHNYPEGFQTLCHNHQWKKEIQRRHLEKLT